MQPVAADSAGSRQLRDIHPLHPLARPWGLAEKREARFHARVVEETAHREATAELSPPVALDQGRHDGLKRHAVQGIAGMGIRHDEMVYSMEDKGTTSEESLRGGLKQEERPEPFSKLKRGILWTLPGALPREWNTIFRSILQFLEGRSLLTRAALSTTNNFEIDSSLQSFPPSYSTDFPYDFRSLMLI